MVSNVSTPPTAEDVLASLGIQSRDGELAGACARIAQRLRANQIRIVGFLPADDTVAVTALLVHLGLALAEPTGEPVAIVDANVRYPALTAAVIGEAEVATGAFARRQLTTSLALIAPPIQQRAGQVIPTLKRLLTDGAEGFVHVLVDLTGFERLGEHAAAATHMDAVAIVARAHETHEDKVAAAVAVVPRDRLLGVTLVG
jgi:hypothetical protein